MWTYLKQINFYTDSKLFQTIDLPDSRTRVVVKPGNCFICKIKIDISFEQHSTATFECVCEFFAEQIR